MALLADPCRARVLLVPTHPDRGRTVTNASPQFDAAALAKALRAWLPERRWFGGKGRPIKSVKVASSTCLRDGDPSLHHVLVDIAYRDGELDLYQIPVGIATTVPEELTGVEIGRVGDG